VSPRELLLALYAEALEAVRAGPAVQRALDSLPLPEQPIVLLAGGKAACAMATAAVDALGERIVRGAAHTREGHGFDVPGIEVREAGHPLPDARSVAAGSAALELAAGLERDEVLLVLLSGGASAIWCAPVAGLTLEDKRMATELLLRGGATIEELNTVRRQLSRIKGGGLARAAGPQRVWTLAVSDVPGDAAPAIGSGPTVDDPTAPGDALAALERHALLDAVPVAVREHLERAQTAPAPEALDLPRGRFKIVASLEHALAAVEAAARARGLALDRVREGLYGDVAEVAKRLERALRSAPARAVDLLLAGGESTVQVRGPGRGGRCQELAVRLALGCGDLTGWAALCAGTDGADGPTDAAGALVDADSAARAREAGLDLAACLERSDSHPALEALGALIRTGPTDTNVTDLALLWTGRRELSPR
jgi:glycerate-2-kinase